MTTDYDTPRVREEANGTEYLAGLDTRRSDAAAATLTADDDSAVGLGDAAEMVSRGLFGDNPTFTVLAQQPDEFTCSRCFLVHHRSRQARAVKDQPICRDCT